MTTAINNNQIKAEVAYIEVAAAITAPIFFGNLAFASGGYAFDSLTSITTAATGFTFIGVYRSTATGPAALGAPYTFVEVDPPQNLKYLILAYNGTPAVADTFSVVAASPTSTDSNMVSKTTLHWPRIGVIAKVLEPGVSNGRVLVALDTNPAASA